VQTLRDDHLQTTFYPKSSEHNQLAVTTIGYCGAGSRVMASKAIRHFIVER